MKKVLFTLLATASIATNFASTLTGVESANPSASPAAATVAETSTATKFFGTLKDQLEATFDTRFYLNCYNFSSLYQDPTRTHPPEWRDQMGQVLTDEAITLLFLEPVIGEEALPSDDVQLKELVDIVKQKAPHSVLSALLQIDTECKAEYRRAEQTRNQDYATAETNARRVAGRNTEVFPGHSDIWDTEQLQSLLQSQRQSNFIYTQTLNANRQAADDKYEEATNKALQRVEAAPTTHPQLKKGIEIFKRRYNAAIQLQAPQSDSTITD